MNFVKIKNFCSAKDLIKRMKDKLQTDRKYLQTTYSKKDYYVDYIKNSQNLTVRTQIIQLMNRQKT